MNNNNIVLKTECLSGLLLLNNNPNIIRLKKKLLNITLNKSMDDTARSSALINYINVHLNKPLDFYLSKYNTDNLPVYNLSLKEGWKSLNQYKNIPGIYKFTALPLYGGEDTYLGSTKNIYQRCYVQHKNQAFNNTNKHLLFYNKVIQNSWESFELSILAIIPDYCKEFIKLYPEFDLSKNDIIILSDLITLELTIAEQIYLN